MRAFIGECVVTRVSVGHDLAPDRLRASEEDTCDAAAP